jgi:hypothetical protein
LSSPLRPPVESVGGNQRTTDLCTFKSPTIYQLTTPSKVGLHHLFVIKNLDIIIEFHSLAICTKTRELPPCNEKRCQIVELPTFTEFSCKLREHKCTPLCLVIPMLFLCSILVAGVRFLHLARQMLTTLNIVSSQPVVNSQQGGRMWTA